VERKCLKIVEGKTGRGRVRNYEMRDRSEVRVH